MGYVHIFRPWGETPLCSTHYDSRLGLRGLHTSPRLEETGVHPRTICNSFLGEADSESDAQGGADEGAARSIPRYCVRCTLQLITICGFETFKAKSSALGIEVGSVNISPHIRKDASAGKEDQLMVEVLLSKLVGHPHESPFARQQRSQTWSEVKCTLLLEGGDRRSASTR